MQFGRCQSCALVQFQGNTWYSGEVDVKITKVKRTNKRVQHNNNYRILILRSTKMLVYLPRQCGMCNPLKWDAMPKKCVSSGYSGGGNIDHSSTQITTWRRSWQVLYRYCQNIGSSDSAIWSAALYRIWGQISDVLSVYFGSHASFWIWLCSCSRSYRCPLLSFFIGFRSGVQCFLNYNDKNNLAVTVIKSFIVGGSSVSSPATSYIL